MERRLIYLWSFCIHIAPASCFPRCEVPSVHKGGPANVTCYFDTDISIMEQEVAVHLINNTGKHKVLDCMWLGHQSYCNPSPGYSFGDKADITTELVLRIPSAAAEHVGTYQCQISMHVPESSESCNFTLQETLRTGKTAEENGKIETAGTDETSEGKGKIVTITHSSRVIVVIVGVISALIVLIAGICTYRCRMMRNRRRSRNLCISASEQAEASPFAADFEDKTAFRLDVSQSIRVVLIGRSGSGKSSLGNSILGAQSFKHGRGFSPETRICDFKTGQRDKYKYHVVDTPGLYDSDMTEDEVNREVARAVALASPGPHIILMVLRCDRRFIQEEYRAYTRLKSLFTEEMCKHMIVVFNGLDMFFSDDDEEGNTDLLTSLKDELDRCQTGALSEILRESKGGHFGMANYAEKGLKDQLIKGLTEKMMNVMRENKYAYYSSPLFESVEKRIDASVSERVQRNPGKTRAEIREELKENIAKGKEPDFMSQLQREVPQFPALKMCEIM